MKNCLKSKKSINPHQPIHNLQDNKESNVLPNNMQYLASSTPVLMYKLKSIPEEYNKYLFYIDENKEDDLKNKLIEICNLDRKKIEKLGLDAQKFIINKKSNFFQCKKILDFIKK